MSEKYMRESDVYRSFIDFWEKRKTFGECLDNVPKFEIEELCIKDKCKFRRETSQEEREYK